MKELYIILIAILITGCGASPEPPTVTVVMEQIQTPSAAPTLTPTFTSTATPKPTFNSTSIPTPTSSPEPTPASIGEIIKFGTLEITLLQVETHSQIVPGGNYYYYAKKGYIFVELGVMVRNTTESPVQMHLRDIYVVDERGSQWFASFGASKTVDVGKSYNPIYIDLSDTLNTGNENISFEKDTYLRLIFSVNKNQSLLFGIQNSPRFTFDVN